jgi:hypothetical protein
MPNQALEQTRDSVLRYGESVGCELLNFFVRQQEAQSQSHEAQSRVGVTDDARCCTLRPVQSSAVRILSGQLNANGFHSPIYP